MSKIELVLTDVDGTLVEVGQHEPTVVVHESISALKEQGVTLTAATARPYEMAHDLFAGLGFEDLCIYDGGASIRDAQTGEFAWRNWLRVERVRSIAAVLLPHAIHAIDFYPEYRESDPEEVSLEDVKEAAPYVFAFVPVGVASEVEQSLKLIPDTVYHKGVPRLDRPGLIDFQVSDKDSTKFHAVSELRKIMHSRKDQTLAIGDSTNDIPLFENAGIRVAMGNAVPELKALADHVVGSVKEDGFAEAMHRFVLK